jgi:hypothetical protein
MSTIIAFEQKNNPQISSDPTPEDIGEGCRLSEIMPERFQAYFDRWVKYWPKKCFIYKRSYKQGWYYQKKKKSDQYQPLYESLAVEHTERHLDGHQWAEWREATGQRVYNQDFWFGLGIPRKTTFSNIDIDAKEYLIGYYQPRQYHKAKQTTQPRPVVYLPVSHLKKVKAIYHAFSGRVWCISSETLGLHAWTNHKWATNAAAIHKFTKQGLQEIGLPGIEVHPMPGRLQRRPFGKDYSTITPDGILTAWWKQDHYIAADGRTPSFEDIIKALLDRIKAQWTNCMRNAGPDLGPYLHHLAEAEQWLAAGCPDGTEAIDQAEELSSPLPSRSTYISAPRVSTQEKTAEQHNRLDLDSLRHGNWPKELARLAHEGLDAACSMTTVIHEMSKYLYWFELYDEDEEQRQEKVSEVLKHFARTKHNGLSSRAAKGDWAEIDRQIENAVKLAARITDPESLEIFCRMRFKRDNGRYRTVICLVPLILGGEELSSPPSSRSTYISAPRVLLPHAMEEEIRQHAGQRPASCLLFAEKLINHLWHNKNSATVSGDQLCQFLGDNGYNSRRQAIKYVNILVDANILKRSQGYIAHKSPKRYTLTAETMETLATAWTDTVKVSAS